MLCNNDNTILSHYLSLFAVLRSKELRSKRSVKRQFEAGTLYRVVQRLITVDTVYGAEQTYAKTEGRGYHQICGGCQGNHLCVFLKAICKIYMLKQEIKMKSKKSN